MNDADTDTQTGTDAPRRRFDPAIFRYDEIEERYADNWLLTYTDLVTLLITLFVILLANSTYGEETGSDGGLLFDIPVAVERTAGADMTAPPVETGAPGPETQEQTGAQTEKADRLRDAFSEAGLSDDVEVEALQSGVAIRISDKILFPSGQAEMLPGGDAILPPILSAVVETDPDIVVEGHTDDLPISTARFPSNWELSAARAISVVKLLIDNGVAPGKLRAAAYADTRPVASNDTPEGRGKNRRVEIILR